MEIIKEKLSNGLTVILAPIENSKSICEVFMVKAGWKYEWPEVYGISHLIEHMMFRGTKKRLDEEEIAAEIESKGGDINAGTDDESTVYSVKLPARFTNIAHDILSDMLLNSKFDPRIIEVERGPISEELACILDDTVGYLENIFWLKLLYGDQPIAQTGLGTEDTINSLERRQLIYYIKKLYVASNSAVIVAGQIENTREMLVDLEKYYGKLSAEKPTLQKLPVVERQRRPRILFKYKKAIQTHVLLGVRGYDLFHPNKYALKVLEVILGGNMSARMFVEVRSKRGLAYDVSSSSMFETDTGWFVTYAGLNSKRIVEGIEVMMDQYRKIKQEKAPEKELKKAKDFILGSMEMALDDPYKLADYLAGKFLLGDQIETPEELARKIKAVTAEDIQRVAEDIFQNKKLNLAIIGPHKHHALKQKLYPILKF